MSWRAPLRRLAFAAAGGLALLAPARAADSGPVTVELNKLETQPKGCRTYFVIANPTETNWQALKLDLVFFRPDGVIDRRYALDLAPLKAGRKIVRTFDLETVPCDAIGSILANDVVDCRDAAGPVTACLDRMTFSSRATAALSK